ncbi:MAG: rRNA maturation RNase YbeY [Planctomycetota bacterium]|jgi:probable rRNA maturation factor
MASDEQDQDIAIQITRNFTTIDMSLSKVEELVKTVCNRFAGPGEPQIRYEVSIAIVDDAEIRKLNSRFLDHKTTTDCLSFDLSDDEEQSEIENRKSKIFDLIVNGEMAVRQAESRGHSSEAELALYITHGLLHNLGFDDSTPDQARRMHDTEDEILQQLGYGFVYNTDERAQDHQADGNR